MIWKQQFQLRFFRTLTITVLLFMLFFVSANAQEKEMAALAPMGALGNFSEMEKQIIFNSLQESLSTHYVLASQKSFEAALTEAFEELDYEECTEDQCFALIQQILQADNLFLFSMTREGNFTQLSLTRVDLDSRRLVRTDDCENCGIGQLNTKVAGLVLKIIEEDKITTAQNKITTEADTQSEKSLSEDNTWHYVAVSVTLVSALMSYNAANSFNDLSAKNSTLATQYANSSSDSEKAAYKSEYDSNASQMITYKSSMLTWDILTLLGLGWEAYLLMSDDSGSEAVNSGSVQSPFIPQLVFQTHPYGTQTVLRWTLSF
jgi:hypothetical protein